MLLLTAILAVTFVPGITPDSRSTHLEAGQANLAATRHKQSVHKDLNLQPTLLNGVIKDTLSSNNINNELASNHVNSSDTNGSNQQWSNYTSLLPPGISYINNTSVYQFVIHVKCHPPTCGDEGEKDEAGGGEDEF